MRSRMGWTFGIVWTVLLGVHVVGRMPGLVVGMPSIRASPEARAVIERGGETLPADGSDFTRFRSAFDSYARGASHPEPWRMAPVLAGIGWLCVVVIRRRFAAAPVADGVDRVGIGLVAVATAMALIQALEARSAWSNWDAWAVWDFKTMAVLREGWLPRSFLADPQYGFTHPEYPLLWPWLQAVMSFVAGGLDARVLRLLPVVCAAATPFVLVALLKEFGIRQGRWLVAGLIATLPNVLDHSANGYVDWPLAAVESVALLLAIRSRRSATPGWAVGLAAGVAANLKVEGLIFGVGLVGAYALDQWKTAGGRRPLIHAAAVFLLLALPWQVVRTGLGMTAADFGLPMAQVASEFTSRAFLFVRGFLLEAFGAGPNGHSLTDWWKHLSSSWLLFWYVAGYALLTGWRCLGDGALRIPVVVLAVQVLGALGAYATTVRDVQWLLSTSLDRLMLQWVPMVTVISAALLSPGRAVGFSRPRV